ncbi:unnamed protein product [Cylindrotheca closterium]|uniref:RING-CH-type domain-containing protein n=1 Tax=Cylindrotheca closterium TaxID=2856 RepID=A0AAD2CZQ8_9STRA|nr:unnamed protein product [Cylindrotheca closterium]
MSPTETTDHGIEDNDVGESSNDSLSPPISNSEADSLGENDEESALNPEPLRSFRHLDRDQRMRVIYGLLFHRMQHSSESDNADHDHANIQPPNGGLQILKQNEAISQNVVCRFCLGQPGDEDQEESLPKNTSTVNPFVSPCNCSGGSEWVHLRCFRRWQCQAASSNSTKSASKICSVCRCAYLLPPLPMNDAAIQPGALLVYMDDEEESSRPSSSFQKSLVLILDHSIHGTTGLIVNSPTAPPEDIEEEEQEREDSNEQLARHDISWRKGGPVCGGRLGVTRYLIAHTYNNASLGAEYEEQQLISHNVISDLRSEDSSHPTHKLQFVYDPRDMECPASFRARELGDVMSALLEGLPQSPEEDEVQSKALHDDQTRPDGEFLVFSGYCRWRGGQLASELQRGAWSVCNHVSPGEMLQPESWNRLRYFSDLLLSYEDLIQEDETVLQSTNH